MEDRTVRLGVSHRPGTWDDSGKFDFEEVVLLLRYGGELKTIARMTKRRLDVQKAERKW